MAFLKIEPNQCDVEFERLATLIEFSKLHPALVKRVKTSATGMDMIMKPEYMPVKAKESADPIVDRQQKLVEFVWTKIMERYKTAAAAFGSFCGHGRLKKS
jgi:hypothetical protein